MAASDRSPSRSARLQHLMRRPIVWIPVSAVLVAVVVARAYPWIATTSQVAFDPRLAAIAIVLNLVVSILWGYRSGRLLKSVGHPISFASATLLASMVYTLNSLTPASTGEVVRAVLLRERHRVPYPVGLGVITVERFVALWYLAASAGWALVVDLGALPAPALVGGWLLIVLVPNLAVRAGVRPGALVRASLPVLRSRWSESLEHGSRQFDDALRELLGGFESLGRFAIVTAALFATFAFQLVLVAAAAGVSVNPVAAWMAVGVAMTAGVLSMLPFGLGATDIVMAGILVRSGVDPAAAAGVAILYRIVSTLPLGLLGVLSYWRIAAGRPPSAESIGLTVD